MFGNERCILPLRLLEVKRGSSALEVGRDLLGKVHMSLILSKIINTVTHVYTVNSLCFHKAEERKSPLQRIANRWVRLAWEGCWFLLFRSPQVSYIDLPKTAKQLCKAPCV